MKDREATLGALFQDAMEALRQIGVSEQTIWCNYYGTFMAIKKFCGQQGIFRYDAKTIRQYIDVTEKRWENKEISKNRRNVLVGAAYKLIEVHDSGDIIWARQLPKSAINLNASNEQFFMQFVAEVSGSYTENTMGDVKWSIRKYLSFLESCGHHSVETVTPADIREFFIYCSSHMKSRSVSNVRVYIRRFHEYLDVTGRLGINYKQIMDFPITSEKKIYPAIEHHQVRKILEQIDTNTDKGVRDYAIIVLAWFSGLRAVDIINLKLADIDWRRGEIRLIQAKTGEYLVLPLMPEAGKAIKNYILYCRPRINSEYVFLSIKTPYRKMKDCMTIEDFFRKYQQKAGLDRRPFDGQGFHAIRRAVGKSLTVSGTPVTTTAQILGHANIESTKQYISLDSVHLKECALDFNGIAVGGMELQV